MAQARTLAKEDDLDTTDTPNPLIITNGDSTGEHFTDPIPHFSTLHDLIRWLQDEEFRPNDKYCY